MAADRAVVLPGGPGRLEHHLRGLTVRDTPFAGVEVDSGRTLRSSHLTDAGRPRTTPPLRNAELSARGATNDRDTRRRPGNRPPVSSPKAASAAAIPRLIMFRPRHTIHHTEGGWFRAYWHFSFDD